jgi:hypothetical protein
MDGSDRGHLVAVPSTKRANPIGNAGSAVRERSSNAVPASGAGPLLRSGDFPNPAVVAAV